MFPLIRSLLTHRPSPQAGVFVYTTVAVRLSLSKLQANTGRSVRRTLLLLATGAFGPFVAYMVFLLVYVLLPFS